MVVVFLALNRLYSSSTVSIFIAPFSFSPGVFFCSFSLKSWRFLFPVFPLFFLQSYHFDSKKFAPLVALPPVLSSPPPFGGDEAVILTVSIKRSVWGILWDSCSLFCSPSLRGAKPPPPITAFLGRLSQTLVVWKRQNDRYSEESEGLYIK